MKPRIVMSAHRPLLMGILNVTPDSFSDGGRFSSVDGAIQRAQTMIAEGANIIDIGPESTRPGADPVSDDEQITRCIPVIQALRKINPAITISIDTRSSRVAAKALAAGADWVNDVSALRDDPEMVRCVAASGVSVVLMHRRGDTKTMQQEGGPLYQNVIHEICEFFRERTSFAKARGIHPDCLLIDPGIGFGKRVEHNFEILRRLETFFSLGYPMVLGASRKSFIGTVTSVVHPADRLGGSLACAVVATDAALNCPTNRGLVLRVHDVQETKQSVDLILALKSNESP